MKRTAREHRRPPLLSRAPCPSPPWPRPPIVLPPMTVGRARSRAALRSWTGSWSVQGAWRAWRGWPGRSSADQPSGSPKDTAS